MAEPAKAIREIQNKARQLTLVIMATVLCGVLATVASVVYTGYANDQQDAKMCRFLHVLEANSPTPTQPESAQQRASRLAFEQYKRDIHCK